LGAALLLFLIGHYSQAQKYYEDSPVYTVGTLLHTCTHIPYPDRESALKGTFETSSFYKSLNGTWAFHWVGKPAVQPEGVYKTDSI